MLLRRFLFSHGCCYITHNFLVNPCSKATAKSEAKSEVKSEANHVEIPEPVKAPVAQVEDPWPRFRERGKDDELVRLVGKVGWKKYIWKKYGIGMEILGCVFFWKATEIEVSL